MFVLHTGVSAQSFKITLNGHNETTLSSGAIDDGFTTEIKQFQIKGTESPVQTYTLKINGEADQTFVTDGQNRTMNFVNDVREKEISLYKGADFKFSFKLLKATAMDNAPVSTFPTESAAEYILKKYAGQLVFTDYGIEMNGGDFGGNSYTHIFLDQTGQPLLATIPQGISNRQYVVHIVYLTPKDDPNTITYTVNQKAGRFNSTLVFNNAGESDNLTLHGLNKKEFKWMETPTVLRTSTDDIEFEVIRNIRDQSGIFEPFMVKTHKIEMSTVYHGSFDVGFINSTLENPTFTLVPLPADPSQYTVKKADGGNRGIVTVMGTLYTSPVVLFERYIMKQDGDKPEIPNYKLSGRNFLDDHKIYERIFPAVGASISEHTFENIFVGLNWEIARGGSVFAGYHYGHVNTFNAPDGFKFGSTAISNENFNLGLGSEWKGSFCYGINLDFMIVRNLFR
jgi:hypothetical protein